MKAITESEFENALKIVNAYFDQVNEKIKKVKSMVSKETRLTDLPFVSIRLLNALKVKYNHSNGRDFTVGWLERVLESVGIKTFCAETRNLGVGSVRELKALCDRIGINYKI